MKKKWSSKEILILEKYVVSNSEKLTSNLYKNIVVGHLRYAKPYGFFTEMSKLLDRSPSQCKSKFYELERELYIELLLISSVDYCLFLNIRQENIEKNNPNILYKSENEIDILSKKGNSGSVNGKSNESDNFSEKKQNGPSQIENGVFYQMTEEETKKKRLKIMHQFLNQKIKLHFKNKG